MEFECDSTATVRVCLTHTGKRHYSEAMERLQHLNPDKLQLVVAELDAQGRAMMPFWVFMRVFGGFNVIDAEWLTQSLAGPIYVDLPRPRPRQHLERCPDWLMKDD